MKKLITVFFIVLTACAPKAPEVTPIVPTPTASPFIVPSLVPETPVPTALPIIVTPTPVPDEPLFYEVMRGDSLSSISAQTGISIDFLVTNNSLKSADFIYAGQVLMLKTREEVLNRMYAEPGKKILVNLTTQQAFAIEGRDIVKTFLVSTGIPAYPTRPGHYKIWIKLQSTRMTGPGYDLSGVPWTMYFDQSRGFHGKYWNNIYGRPSSHGCVNMTNEDAKWLYDWADPPTKDVETYPTAEFPGTDVWIIP